MKYFLVFSLFFINGILSKDEKCRALVLEGGGDKGAWQAGALNMLFEKLSADEAKYDVVAGVSAGALNGLLLSTYEKGHEKNFGREVVQIWRNLKEHNLFDTTKSKAWGLVKGLISSKSFLDNNPMGQLIYEIIKLRFPLKRDFTIGVTDASTSESISINANSLELNDIAMMVKASASMPGVFPYVKYQGRLLIDGGVVINADFRSAIHKCREKKFKDEDIILDALLPTAGFLSYLDPNKEYTAKNMLDRYLEIKRYKDELQDYFYAHHDFPKINWRYIIMPQKPLPSELVPISFSDDTLKKMIQMGKDDAEAIINNPDLTLLGKKGRNAKDKGFFHNNRQNRT